MSEVLLHTGDTAPALTGVCRNGTDPASLTGATAVAHIRKPDGTVISREVDVTDPAEGTWSLEWEADELDAAGVYETEVEVTFADERVQTFGPDTFTVQAQIA